jgi:hypothetical protein
MCSKSSVVAFIAVLWLVFGCGVPKVVQDYQRDSVAYIVRDTTIFRDSVVYVQIPAESDKAVVPDTDTSRLRTSVAESEAWVAEGQLFHTLTNKDALIPIEVKLPKYIHTEEKAMVRNVREVVEVEKELSRWQNFIQALGYAVLIAGLAWLIWKLSKVIRMA